MRCLLTILFALCVAVHTLALQLGEWTHHYAYNNLTHVIPTQKDVYALSAGRLFIYHTGDGSISECNTINMLNDAAAITDICWNKQTAQLTVAYETGNIDLLNTRNGKVINIAAIVNETSNRSKEIKTLYANGKYTYVVMPYGVIVLNTEKQEVADTYRFTLAAGEISGVYVEKDSIYVIATADIATYGTNTIAGKLTDNLIDRTLWHAVGQTRASEIKASIDGDKQKRLVYKGTQTNYVEDTYRNCYWAGEADGAMQSYTISESGEYQPQWQKGVKPYGPSSNDFFTIRWMNNRLYTVGSGLNSFQENNKDGVVQVYNPNEGWTTYEAPTKEQIQIDYKLTYDITVDPIDTSHVMVAARSGVYEFKGGKFVKRWYNENSTLMGYRDNSFATEVQFVYSNIYTNDGKLIALNSYTSRCIHALEQNGEESNWQHLSHPEIDDVSIDKEHVLARARTDSKGNIWFISMSWRDACYFCYNPQTDNLITFRPNYNQDGARLYNNNGDGILSDINIDNDGNVWLCGNKGVCYLPYSETTESTEVVEQHKISRNDGTGLADYLLSTIDATCIIFDSAGRKYIGTNGNGVFVISADNNSEIENYTTATSGIMSDIIFGLALDEKTGTLYCATNVGLCSVTTDAIQVPASLDEDNIKVYPNPAPADYTGPITIEGLTVGADVKITTASGYVVHTGRTTSALYTWDGCDMNGNRCASGVYNVLLATEDGSKGCVAKVALIR